MEIFHICKNAGVDRKTTSLNVLKFVFEMHFVAFKQNVSM